MSNLRKLATGAAALAALVVTGVIVGEVLQAADHADSPDTSEGNLDINDLFAFTNGNNIVFAVTVAPLLTPGEATNGTYLNPEGLYQIKLDRERDGIAEAVIQIAASGTGANQVISVRGPVSPTAPMADQLEDAPAFQGGFNTSFVGNGMQAFVGPRDDPFYVDLFGDMSLTSVLNAAFSAALGEEVGDPDEQSFEFNPNATDDLAGINTLAIVIEMPKSAVADALGIGTSDTFFAWSTTSIRN